MIVCRLIPYLKSTFLKEIQVADPIHPDVIKTGCGTTISTISKS